MNSKNKLKKIVPIAILGVILIILIIVTLRFSVLSIKNYNVYDEDYSHTHFEEISKINFANKNLLTTAEKPVILFASDYQGDMRVENTYSIFEKTREYITPELFVACGDYQVQSSSNFGYSEYGILELSEIFSECFAENIPQIYIQGNHDSLEANGIADEGIYESDKYIIYVINEISFPNIQTEQPDQENTVINTAERLKNDLQMLVEKNTKKPIFISTHVPLHYTFWVEGKDNAYANYIVDVLNTYGEKLNLFYLFGHNHSGTYDDYIGGSINYIGNGELMHVGGSNVSTKINFTYLNAGYIGEIKSSLNDKSENEGSVTAIEIENDNVVIQKYTKYGKYYTDPIVVNTKK